MKRRVQPVDVSSLCHTNCLVTIGLVISFFVLDVSSSFAQNVGIGTPTPLAKLHVAEKSVAFTATGEAPDSFVVAPITGSGRRMMWFAEKGAFVAGFIAANQWDGPEVGKYSFAGGYNCSAQGDYSIAMGIHSIALAPGSIALGENCVTDGVNSLAVGNEAATFNSSQASIALGFSAHAFSDYSIALGYQTTASGEASVATGYLSHTAGAYSTAMGKSTFAGGNSAMAMGNLSNASGDYSTAMGSQSRASGAYSTAMGNNTAASGSGSTAMGIGTAAGGYASTAMGTFSTAGGYSSVAMGENVEASGDASIAMGSYVSTSNHFGCFTIGDQSTTTVMQTFVDNGFRSRFAGGYRLFTNSAANVGAFLNANANSWAALSDIRTKENFLPVNGELILQRIAEMPQFTWNYIGQDVKKLRHYGPMGQDFYKAFGKDSLGEIGCDTLINQQDFLGVNFIAIQALEKRTQEQKEMILELRKEIEDLKKKKK